MRVLVACEFSGTVRQAFTSRGHEAWSCDFLPTVKPGLHHQGDVLEFARTQEWDIMLAFPPCTFLASSGARWWRMRQKEQAAAIQFVLALSSLPIGKIAIENPIGRLSTAWRRPDQIIQPWQHGHGETKSTCLWLQNLPLLCPTNIVDGRVARIHQMSDTPDRSRLRSITYQGIANAMAMQWG